MFIYRAIKRLAKKIRSLILSEDLKYINGHYFHKNYLPEVKCDLEYLKEMMGLQRYERNQDATFQNLVQKYEKEYCPSKLFGEFSSDNELEYLVLRLEIDEILKNKDSDPF